MNEEAAELGVDIEQVSDIDINNVARNTEELARLLASDLNDIVLSQGEFEIDGFDFNSPKTISGVGRDKTRIKINGISCNALVTIKDAIISSLDNKKSAIESVGFNGSIELFNIDEENLDLLRSFKIRRLKDIGILELSEKEEFILDETVEINYKELNIRNVSFVSKAASGFIFKKCTGKIENCSFSYSGEVALKDGDKPASIIHLEESHITIGNSEIKNGIRQGIYSVNSELLIRDCLIFNNRTFAIFCSNNSNLKIQSSDIHGNGTKGSLYSQIWIMSSIAEINASKIYDSLGGSGLSADGKSKVSLTKSEVYKNKEFGLYIGGSTLSIDDSSIYQNGTKGKHFQQIYLKSSTAAIKNSKAGEGFGYSIGAEKNSNLAIGNSRVDKLIYDPSSEIRANNDCAIGESRKTFGVFSIYNANLK